MQRLTIYDGICLASFTILSIFPSLKAQMLTISLHSLYSSKIAFSSVGGEVSFEEHSTPTRNVITLLSLCSNTLKRTR
jgi:hypothetical protein